MKEKRRKNEGNEKEEMKNEKCFLGKLLRENINEYEPRWRINEIASYRIRGITPR